MQPSFARRLRRAASRRRQRRLPRRWCRSDRSRASTDCELPSWSLGAHTGCPASRRWWAQVVPVRRRWVPAPVSHRWWMSAQVPALLGRNRPSSRTQGAVAGSTACCCLHFGGSNGQRMNMAECRYESAQLGDSYNARVIEMVCSMRMRSGDCSSICCDRSARSMLRRRRERAPFNPRNM
jgi:hypothetical protein